MNRKRDIDHVGGTQELSPEANSKAGYKPDVVHDDESAPLSRRSNLAVPLVSLNDTPRFSLTSLRPYAPLVQRHTRAHNGHSNSSDDPTGNDHGVRAWSRSTGLQRGPETSDKVADQRCVPPA